MTKNYCTVKWTKIMLNEHFRVNYYIKDNFKIKFRINEIFQTQSMMHNESFIIIIKFTGSRFNYSLIDFEKEKILCACQPWNILIQNLKRLAKG